MSMKNTASKKNTLFTKDFTLMVIGQIISLFGNAALRFALPLYILDRSNSPALFGLVSASSFLPMILMSPIGGIIADRVNKQRIMVVLDFFTAALILGFLLLSGQVAAAPLVVVMLMFLYAVQGAYSPAVQASIPALASSELLMPANATVNLVNSFSGLLGPIVGGILYTAYGLTPILVVSGICFTFSAVMELFIRIPHQNRKSGGSVLAIVRGDLGESLRFILHEQPVMARVVVLIFLFNLFMSAMLTIGTPVIVTQYLGLSGTHLGFTQGAMAAGGLAGGLAAGIFSKRLDIRQSHILLLICGGGILPMSAALLPGVPAMLSYTAVTALTFLLMICATIFSVQMLAFVQRETPTELVGKVISCLMALSICAQPIGQALYGMLFERLGTTPFLVLLGASLISCAISLYSKKTFGQLTQQAV